MYKHAHTYVHTYTLTNILMGCKGPMLPLLFSRYVEES